MDGMGTAWRGKKFEELCYKNLKDAGFPDRELWIKAAAAKYPYIDANNVGIFEHRQVDKRVLQQCFCTAISIKQLF